eukprot:NODE_4411_length_1172_cov_32.376549_g3898_i0.p1 GENE.NODE_4411_length_1172_cov_32.376549_g3898_i0~~NODE_4411_length_1172_cov_32.376549_g3898_i0.p1  ORF type:complete len:336 (-),score=41.32 NODE_4411_length_1172_cov_32.376549_g3898_i0:40-1047(-)
MNSILSGRVVIASSICTKAFHQLTSIPMQHESHLSNIQDKVLSFPMFQYEHLDLIQLFFILESVVMLICSLLLIMSRFANSSSIVMLVTIIIQIIFHLTNIRGTRDVWNNPSELISCFAILGALVIIREVSQLEKKNNDSAGEKDQSPKNQRWASFYLPSPTTDDSSEEIVSPMVLPKRFRVSQTIRHLHRTASGMKPLVSRASIILGKGGGKIIRRMGEQADVMRTLSITCCVMGVLIVIDVGFRLYHSGTWWTWDLLPISDAFDHLFFCYFLNSAAKRYNTVMATAGGDKDSWMEAESLLLKLFLRLRFIVIVMILKTTAVWIHREYVRYAGG